MDDEKLGNEDHAIERLAALIERRTGITMSSGQRTHLDEVAQQRLRESGLEDLEDYVEILETTVQLGEWRRLVSALTIKESFLFRIPQQFVALDRVLVPRLVKNRPEDHVLRLWSAGCARGEEPATLAIVLAECPALARRRWEILATDVDEMALATARRGEFRARAMERVPPELVRRYFEPRDDAFVLAKELEEHIELRAFNLVESPFASLGPPFDVILLRNVLIYFSPEIQRHVLSRAVSRLAPDGYLFVGHSESLWKLSDELELVELEGCFAYRRKAPAQRISTPAPSKVRPKSSGVRRSSSALRDTMPAIPRAKRLVGVTGRPTPRQEALEEVASALRDGRFEAVRVGLEALPATSQDARLHALQGLLHDLEGRDDEAVKAYRAALFLDAGLYQIRYRLARALARLDWDERARHEYARTLRDLGGREGRELGLGLKALLLDRPRIAESCRRALRNLLEISEDGAS